MTNSELRFLQELSLAATLARLENSPVVICTNGWFYYSLLIENYNESQDGEALVVIS